MVAVDDAVDDGEPEAAGAAGPLGREERLEQAPPRLLRHAGARVLNVDADVGVRLGLEVPLAERLGRDAVGADRELAAVRHRIPGIDGEVHEGLMNLIAVGTDRGNVGAELHVDLDVLREGFLDERGHFPRDRVDVRGRKRRLGLPGEGQELLDDPAAPLDRLLDRLDAAARQLRLRPSQAGQVGRDDVEDVVEVVGDAAGQVADRIELLHLAELIEHPRALADVAQVALDDPAASQLVHVADRLDDDALAGLGAHLELGLEVKPPAGGLAEAAPKGLGIAGDPDFPRPPADELLAREHEHVDEVRIDVENLPGFAVQNPDPLPGGLEDPPVPRLRGPKLRFGLLALRDVVDRDEDEGPGLAGHPDAAGVEEQGPLAQPFRRQPRLEVLQRFGARDHLLEGFEQPAVLLPPPPEIEEELAFGLEGRHRERAIEGLVRRADPELLVENHERFPDRLDQRLGVVAGRVRLFERPLERIDVHEGEDGPVDAAVERQVGAHAHQVPPPVDVLDLALERSQGRDDALDQRFEVRDAEIRLEVADAAPTSVGIRLKSFSASAVKRRSRPSVPSIRIAS